MGDFSISWCLLQFLSSVSFTFSVRVIQRYFIFTYFLRLLWKVPFIWFLYHYACHLYIRKSTSFCVLILSEKFDSIGCACTRRMNGKGWVGGTLDWLIFFFTLYHVARWRFLKMQVFILGSFSSFHHCFFLFFFPFPSLTFWGSTVWEGSEVKGSDPLHCPWVTNLFLSGSLQIDLLLGPRVSLRKRYQNLNLTSPGKLSGSSQFQSRQERDSHWLCWSNWGRLFVKPPLFPSKLIEGMHICKSQVKSPWSLSLREKASRQTC